MITLYKVLANCAALLHLLVALYMLSLLVCVFLKKLPRWYLPVQSIIIGTSAVFHFTTGVCPLTFVEKHFRVAAGGTAYDGNFLNFYSEKYFQTPLPDKLIVGFIVLFVLVLIFMLLKRVVVAKRPLFTTGLVANGGDINSDV